MTTEQIVTTLREAYNDVQDGTLDVEQAEYYIELFDILDTRLMHGDPLPRAWRR